MLTCNTRTLLSGGGGGEGGLLYVHANDDFRMKIPLLQSYAVHVRVLYSHHNRFTF